MVFSDGVIGGHNHIVLREKVWPFTELVSACPMVYEHLQMWSLQELTISVCHTRVIWKINLSLSFVLISLAEGALCIEESSGLREGSLKVTDSALL